MALHAADVIVVGLIGERGREVKDFIENIPRPRRSRARLVAVIAAPADVSPLLRMQGAVCHPHRRRPRSHKVRVADYGVPLTRYAMAQR